MTNNIPDVLTAKDLQAYLHISRAGAYNLLSRAEKAGDTPQPPGVDVKKHWQKHALKR